MSGIKTVLGFDLGHGETSAATAEVLWDKPVQNLQPPKDRDIIVGKPVIPTAYAVDRMGKEKIGIEALEEKGEGAMLALAFKKRPTLMSEGETLLLMRYAKNVYEKLLQNDQMARGGMQVFVGCPSGWLEKDREKYEEVLSKALSEPVKVMKESKAAVVYALKDDNNRITANHIKEGVLIIDFGSSTCDITYFRGVDEPINMGFDLGATEIENNIFKYIIQEYKQLGDYEKYQQAFEDDVKHVNKLKYACRRAKEDYFSNIVGNGAYQVIEDIRIKKGLHFEIELNQESMKKILDMPVDFRHKDQKTRSSWKACCHQILTDIKKSFEDSGRHASAVILTGGASRMYFVRASCKEIFKGSKLIWDSNPSTCISRGLAEAGRADLRAEVGREKVYVAIKQLMEDKYELLVSKMAAAISVHIFDKLIKPSLIDWRDGKVGYKTLRDMENKIRIMADSLKDSEEFQGFIKSALVNWVEDLTPDINQIINTIFAKEYGSNVQGGKVDIALKLKNSFKEFDADNKVKFNSKEYINFDAAAEAAGAVTAIITLIVSYVVGFIVSYIGVMIGLYIIATVVLFTGIGAPVALWMYAHSWWIAGAVAAQGGDLYELISDKFGEGTAKLIKGAIGDPETKEYSAGKRTKYYDKMAERFGNIKESIEVEIKKSIQENEKSKKAILESMDTVLKESIELAMRYASLNI